jgi:glucose 1-dehydrogenase
MSDHARPLEGRVGIVTGAAGGMGRAIVEALGAAGASVVAADLDAEAGREAAVAVESAGGQAIFVQVDVSSASDVEAMVDAAMSTFGRLDCAVNGAAIEFETVPLADTPDADFDRMMAVNLRSVFLCMKYEIRAMLAAGNGGSIVNIASTNAFRPQRNQPAYTASKHGVMGLTKSAALDYTRKGIRVNAISPGAIDTPMLGGAIERWGLDPENVRRRMSLFGRFGRPEEIAAAAVFLCSDASSFTTGTSLAVDGGFLAH